MTDEEERELKRVAWLRERLAEVRAVNGHRPQEMMAMQRIKGKAFVELVRAQLAGRVPSAQLLHLVGDLLGVWRYPRGKVKATREFEAAVTLKRGNPSIGVRALARAVGVSPSRVSEWQKSEKWRQAIAANGSRTP
jgi:hypothetical protein